MATAPTSKLEELDDPGSSVFWRFEEHFGDANGISSSPLSISLSHESPSSRLRLWHHDPLLDSDTVLYVSQAEGFFVGVWWAPYLERFLGFVGFLFRVQDSFFILVGEGEWRRIRRWKNGVNEKTVNWIIHGVVWCKNWIIQTKKNQERNLSIITWVYSLCNHLLHFLTMFFIDI